MHYLDRHILIVEDEVSLAEILSEYLQQSGFIIHIINEGLGVIDWVKGNKPDLIILDLMLPHRDGLDIYRELRTFSQTPVIMATARVDEIDRLIGLELGADDYICKPYSIKEIVARVKNILRRIDMADLSESNSTILLIDEAKMKVYFYGEMVDLTPAEFKLLNFLFRHQGFIYNRDQLMSHIYSDNRIVFDRIVDSHIKNLRRKLQKINADNECIKSVYGVGYKLEL